MTKYEYMVRLKYRKIATNSANRSRVCVTDECVGLGVTGKTREKCILKIKGIAEEKCWK
jgi:hypothetical protein